LFTGQLYKRIYRYDRSRFTRKIAKTKLKVLIHPSFVRKSYLYQGIPPLTTISKPINIINFRPMKIDRNEVTFSVEKKLIMGYTKTKPSLYKIIKIVKIINIIII
jgi:hypothetical protein